jgi:hypothetical protein
MKSYRIIPKSHARRIPVPLLLLAFLVLSSGLLHAQAPAWWQQRGVLNSGVVDDFAVINQGQLKNFVRGASMELEANLPGGAGRPLLKLLAQWASPTAATDDFAAANLGQLKALASAVFDRLMAAGYASAYPWAGASDDYAMANIGQVKNVFKFNLTVDTDTDGLPDWWEMKYFGQLGSNAGTMAPVGNGFTLAQCFQYSINPVSADTDGDGVPDSLDAYAMDSSLTQLPALNPGDTTPPTITLMKPIGAILGP